MGLTKPEGSWQEIANLSQVITGRLADYGSPTTALNHCRPVFFEPAILETTFERHTLQCRFRSQLAS